MVPEITRRRFLFNTGAVCAGGLIGATPASGLVVPTDAPLSPIHYRTHGFSEKHGERDIIRRAMNILHTHLRSDDVIRNAYQLAPGAYHIESGYWTDSRMHRQGIHQYHDLLWFQLGNLATLQRFPKVGIHAYHEQGRSYGKAEVGRVKVRWREPQHFDVKGSFKVYLNRYHLGSRGIGSEPRTWAAVIAHEMLHNLGHMHGVGDYRDDQQIVAFERSVYWSANCWSGRRTPVFPCG